MCQEWKNSISIEKGYLTEMEFLYRHEEGEIDLLVPLSNIILGIEIKYLSGISSEDVIFEESIGYEESCNQLARYSC